MHDTSWEEDVNNGQNTIGGSDTYFLLECGGCEDVQMRHESWFSENYPGDDPTVKCWPPPAISRRRPDWLNDIRWAFGSEAEVIIGELLNEIYTGLQTDSRRSAAIGIRALLERMMVDQVGDAGRIELNVAAFLEGGFISAQYHKLFRDILIEGGHAAMHRGWKPSKDELGTMLDLSESLIAAIYVHPQRAAAVQAKIPPRPRKTK